MSIVTKDALLADLARALKSTHPERADAMLHALEPALTDGSPRVAGEPSTPLQPFPAELAEFATRAAAALTAAFPDRGADLAEQLRMQVALGRIDRWHAIHRAEFHQGLNAGATEEQVAELEKHTGLTLPTAMHALYRWRNGQGGYSSFYSYNTFMDTQGSAASWQIMHDLIPQFEGDGQTNWWHDGWLSFLENGGGDSIVLDTLGTFTGTKNQLIEFWHDDSPRNVLFPDLMTWAETFAESLEKGMWSDDDGFQLTDEAAYRALVGERAPGHPIDHSADG